MYFKGQGVPADRPLGTAWMVLAAERGNPQYVKAQNLMISLLTDTQFAKTDTLWGKLKKTYGDKVALHRAKVRWAWVKTHQTGTRVGGATGELRVGVRNTGHIPGTLDARGKPMNTTTTAGGMLQGGSVDGSVAYRQFRLSDNPYSPIFLKNRTGSVVVDPLVQIHKNDKNDKTKHTSSTKNSDQPQNPTD